MLSYAYVAYSHSTVPLADIEMQKRNDTEIIIYCIVYADKTYLFKPQGKTSECFALHPSYRYRRRIQFI